MNFKKKFSEIKSKASKKWNEIDNKYPWFKWVLFGCGVTVIGGGMYYISKKVDNDNSYTTIIPADDKNKYLGMVSNYEHDPIKQAAMDLDNDEKIYFDSSDADSTGSLKEIWEEFYKDNWDEVSECAKRLSLKPGEMFIIEDPTQYGDSTEPIISHLVNNTGVYPPEE